MKIRISYFYQIRNFKKNMIPMSTAMWDPAWYHAGLGPDHIYTDKRGILNGLRLKPIIVQGNTNHICPCENKDPQNCMAMKEYRQELDKIDFQNMMCGIRAFADRYKKNNDIKEEIIMILIVYETPNNKCSERQTLIDYFNDNGVECKELDYPINSLVSIKNEPFDF